MFIIPHKIPETSFVRYRIDEAYSFYSWFSSIYLILINTALFIMIQYIQNIYDKIFLITNFIIIIFLFILIILSSFLMQIEYRENYKYYNNKDNKLNNIYIIGWIYKIIAISIILIIIASILFVVNVINLLT